MFFTFFSLVRETFYTNLTFWFTLKQNSGWFLITKVLSISWFLDRIEVEHVQSICSSETYLIFDSICSIGTRSRTWDIFRKHGFIREQVEKTKIKNSTFLLWWTRKHYINWTVLKKITTMFLLYHLRTVGHIKSVYNAQLFKVEN